MKKLKIIFLGTLLISVFLIGAYVQRSGDIYYEISRNMELFGKIYKEISFNYVDEIDPQEFMRAGIKGMLNSLDPYTVFIDENRQDDVDLITSGKYGGIGVSIGVRNDRVTIIEIFDGYSAQKQGLRVGDVIIQAAGDDINADNVDDLSGKVKGEPGTSVELKILRNDNPDTLIFNIIREEVVLKNLAYADFYPKKSNNVYLKLTNFSRSASEEITNAIKELRKEKPINSIVLDLRGNPGGLLDVAIEICDKFLKKDLLIVSTRGREEYSEKNYYAIEEPVLGNEKLIILINENSASASEIVAGAIQDHDRGVILGTQSYGKGLVQTITPLTYNTSIKLTTAKYYTPSGRSIQKVDYSKDNIVFKVEDSLSVEEFLTDNKRSVYSAGGITPDSSVMADNFSEITSQLLAKGIFFSFADKFYYLNQNEYFEKINNEKLFKNFKDYLAESDFDYTPEVEKLLNSLVDELTEKEIDGKVTESINKLKEELHNYHKNEIDKFKDEILSQLKIELAYRYLGSNQSIEQRLNEDNQFNTAIKLLGSEKDYNRLLKSNK